MHANSHPFDGDELEEIASQITFLYGETDRLRQVNVDFARTIGGLSTSLTALRQAAEAARVALEAIVKRNAPFGDLQSVSIANAALAALRARLEETK